ncbi:MAG: SRPBCC family protein [Bryobacteraceae bacterium]
MGMRARSPVALVLLIIIVVGGVALLRFGIYGWTIFVLLPVFLGGVASWTFRPHTAGRAVCLGALTVAAATCLLLIMGLEGLVCIGMALPLVMLLGALGGWLAHQAESSRVTARSLTTLLLLSPAALTWDAKAPPTVFEVRTQIVVRATPEQVWKHVVTFSELPEPQEWFFRTGLAYPKRARIDGSGPGAIRYCEFSTGAFVEPIEVWDEPRLLRFRVTENPAPMHEWLPYSAIEPKHLHGYLVSKRGQFRLTRLANGRTLLEGTTWYQHGLWPAEYWRWWSDAIIHRIHLRVLNHVRIVTEQEAEGSW